MFCLGFVTQSLHHLRHNSLRFLPNNENSQSILEPEKLFPVLKFEPGIRGYGPRRQYSIKTTEIERATLLILIKSI